MRYFLLFCLLASSAFADDQSNWTMQQQINQMQMDQQAAQQGAALHQEFNPPPQPYQSQDVQYVPAGNDPNPPSRSLMY